MNPSRLPSNLASGMEKPNAFHLVVNKENAEAFDPYRQPSSVLIASGILDGKLIFY